MTQYMDYGNVGGSTAAPTPVINKDRGQVFLATHDEQDKLLSSMRRSFISFSWGRKNIEDFNFIVTTEDRHEGAIYAPFEDMTTKNELLDGQYFWGTAFSPKEVTFTLSTDGITEDLLQSFKNWFKPGIAKELILAESPNKVIYARISEPPEISLMPFEKKVDVKIGKETYSTSTTQWRGDVTLNFIMDDPFWESINSIYEGSLNEDIVKVIFEDGIPHINMFTVDNFDDKFCFLANNQYIYTEEQEENGVTNTVITLTKNSQEKRPSRNLDPSETYYLYNCGTAPAKPIIHFGFVPVWDDNNNYISFPPSSYDSNMPNKEQYFTITIGGHTFKLSTPGILASYNQAAKIVLNDFNPGDAIVELKKAFRDSISDVYVRMMSMAICELAENELWRSTLNICDETGALQSNFNRQFLTCLKGMFATNPRNQNQCTFVCEFNSLTGEATVSTYILVFDPNKISSPPGEGNLLDILPWKKPSGNQQTTPIHVLQNAGDMVRSEYLIIDERTLPDNGIIFPKDCLKLTINTGENNDNFLYDFSIVYNYMYY